MKIKILYCFFLFVFSSAWSQVDSTEFVAEEDTSLVADTIKTKKKWERPRKALWLSAVCPGLGHIYNGKTYYWKVPIMYAGFATIIYFFNKNQVEYKKYDVQYDYFYKNQLDKSIIVYYVDPKTGFKYTTLNQIKTQRDGFRRYRDMAIFFGCTLYALNILDAYVEAHLLDFDISPDLSMKVEPVFMSGNNVSFAPGLSFQFNFKANQRFKAGWN